MPLWAESGLLLRRACLCLSDPALSAAHRRKPRLCAPGWARRKGRDERAGALVFPVSHPNNRGEEGGVPEPIAVNMNTLVLSVVR